MRLTTQNFAIVGVLMPDIESKEGKKEIIKRHSPPSPVVKNSIIAFLVGGLICLIAEGLYEVFVYLGSESDSAGLYVSLILILAAAILTALGVFDVIARRAGAGTLVPITGFSNAVTSQALDAKSEGMILGVGAKIFTVSGPVILYGLMAGAAYGAIYYLVTEIIKMQG